MKREEQLIPRLKAYFERNPEEFLSFDDIAVKFDTTRDKAKIACMHLRARGLIQTMVVAMVNPDRQQRK